jgi:hypothetical protein
LEIVTISILESFFYTDRPFLTSLLQDFMLTTRELKWPIALVILQLLLFWPLSATQCWADNNGCPAAEEQYAGRAIPAALKAELLLMGPRAQSVLQEYESVPVMSAQHFLAYTNLLMPRFLAAGFNGSIFRSSDGWYIIKLSHSVFYGGCAQAWADIKEHGVFGQYDPATVHFFDIDWIDKSMPTWKELLGSVVWASYMSEHNNSDVVLEDFLPIAISEDGNGYIRRFIPGVPLNLILAQDRSPGRTQYNMQSIWKQVATLQRLGERILLTHGSKNW